MNCESKAGIRNAAQPYLKQGHVYQSRNMISVDAGNGDYSKSSMNNFWSIRSMQCPSKQGEFPFGRLCLW